MSRGGSLEGLCPRCLMGLGLSSSDPREATGRGAVPAEPPGGGSREPPFEGPVPAEPPGGGPREPPFEGSGEPPFEVSGEPPALTLHAGAPGTASLVAGQPGSLESETASLLHRRLWVGTLIGLLGIGLFLSRDLLRGLEGAPIWDRVTLLALLGGVLLALRSPAPSLVRLRRLEVLVVGSLAGWIVFDRYRFIHRAAATDDPEALVFAVAFAGFVSFALVTAYGVFVPNTRGRALRMTLGLASLPFLVVAAVAWTSPADRVLLREAVGFVPLTSLGLMMLVGVALAMAANQRIQQLRREAFEARRIGQYRLVRRIGAGGMGEVWEAEHRLLVRPAAVKLIRPEMVDPADPERAGTLLRWFEREARATAALRSVHTVELYDFGLTEDGVFYYVMELLDGLDLDSLVRRHGPVEPERAAYLLTQVCDSLADAHEARFIHRDIKPANLFVCRMGRARDFVKVLDFGLVKATGVTGSSEPVAEHLAATVDGAGSASDVGTVPAGRIVGTPGFMAPEVLRGEPVDGRADLYSVGCVAYWLLTGRPVFEAGDRDTLIRHHLERRPEPPSRHRPDIPGRLEEVVMACLSREPSGRPQDAETLARQLVESLPGDRAWTPERARTWWRDRP